jgi:hypothetical protein
MDTVSELFSDSSFQISFAIAVSSAVLLALILTVYFITRRRRKHDKPLFISGDTERAGDYRFTPAKQATPGPKTSSSLTRNWMTNDGKLLSR